MKKSELEKFFEEGKTLKDKIFDALVNLFNCAKINEDIRVIDAVFSYDDPNVSKTLETITQVIKNTCESLGHQVKVSYRGVDKHGHNCGWSVVCIQRPFYGFYIYPPRKGADPKHNNIINVRCDLSGKKPSTSRSWVH